jgi:hypothetical protein
VLSDATVRSLDSPANLVCKVADELEGRATLSDETFDELYGAFGRREATELLFILSFYSAVRDCRMPPAYRSRPTICCGDRRIRMFRRDREVVPRGRAIRDRAGPGCRSRIATAG